MDNNINKLEERLERIEEKLDTYLQATTETKKDVEWLKGSVRGIFTVIISTVGLVFSAFINSITK